MSPASPIRLTDVCAFKRSWGRCQWERGSHRGESRGTRSCWLVSFTTGRIPRPGLILRHAREAIPAGGRLFIVEMVLPEAGFAGSLCDLHLLMVQTASGIPGVTGPIPRCSMVSGPFRRTTA